MSWYCPECEDDQKYIYRNEGIVGFEVNVYVGHEEELRSPCDQVDFSVEENTYMDPPTCEQGHPVEWCDSDGAIEVTAEEAQLSLFGDGT